MTQKGGFMGIDNLQRKAKKNDKTIKMKDIENWLKTGSWKLEAEN